MDLKILEPYRGRQIVIFDIWICWRQSGCCANVRRRSFFYKGVSVDYAFCEGRVEILYSATERRQDIIQQLGSILCLVGYFRL